MLKHQCRESSQVVSHSYGDECEDKMLLYAKLGVLYYVIYNPLFWQRDRHQPFEVYHLEQGSYQQQIGEPYWMPEIGLGIGRGRYKNGRLEREVLYWFDDRGQRYLVSEEQAQLETQQAQRETQQARLEAQQAQQELERYRIQQCII